MSNYENEKMLFNRMMRDAYEQDREDNAVNEGIVGWSETCEGCGKYRCICEPEDDGRYDLGEIGDDGPTPEHYGDSVEDTQQAGHDDLASELERIRKAANSQFLFFMDAMKRNGVL